MPLQLQWNLPPRTQRTISLYISQVALIVGDRFAFASCRQHACWCSAYLFERRLYMQHLSSAEAVALAK